MKDRMNQLLTELREEIKEEIKKEIKKELLDELMRHNEQQKMWMNKKETAAYLGISPNTFSKYLSKYPNFPVSDLAGTKRYNAKQVDEFIAITDMMN